MSNSVITASKNVATIYLEFSKETIDKIGSNYPVYPHAMRHLPVAHLFNNQAPIEALQTCLSFVGKEVSVDFVGFASDAYVSAMLISLNDDGDFKSSIRTFMKAPFAGTVQRLHVCTSTSIGVMPIATNTMLRTVGGTMLVTPVTSISRICVMDKLGNHIKTSEQYASWLKLFDATPASAPLLVPATPASAPLPVPTAPVKPKLVNPFAASVRNIQAELETAKPDTTEHSLVDEAVEISHYQYQQSACDNLSSVSASESVNMLHDNEVERVDGDQMCTTDGCDVYFVPENAEVKRCLECRKHKTAIVRDCGCGEKIYMSQSQVTFLKNKHGDKFQTYTQCWSCTTAAKGTSMPKTTTASAPPDSTIVYNEPCTTKDCEGRIQLSKSEHTFFTGIKKGTDERMVLPKHCSECRSSKPKTVMVEGSCGHEKCDKLVTITQDALAKLESKSLKPHCNTCRETKTRSCQHCKKSFFTKANETEFADKGWLPPRCCSKQCAQDAGKA